MIQCQEAAVFKIKKNNQKHFLTQTYFLFVPRVLCDYIEIKISAVQSHYRYGCFHPQLSLSNSTASPSSVALPGSHFFSFDSHSPKPEHLSQVPSALRLH